MKFLLRNTAIYALTLFLLPQLLSGLKVVGGLPILLISGCILTLMSLLLKPIFNIISIPLNFLTLGLFSALVNVLILYLLTIFVPNVSVHPFSFAGFSLFGFIIPHMQLGLFSAYLAIGVALSFVSGFFRWIVK